MILGCDVNQQYRGPEEIGNCQGVKKEWKILELRKLLILQEVKSQRTIKKSNDLNTPHKNRSCDISTSGRKESRSIVLRIQLYRVMISTIGTSEPVRSQMAQRGDKIKGET